MGKAAWWVLGVMVAILIWATLPPGQFSLDAECRPDTLRARVSAVLYGNAFWRAQLAAAAVERDHLLARLEHPEGDEDTGIAARMMRLNNQAEQGADDERQQDADAAHNRRQLRVGILSVCSARIQQRLAQ